MSFGTLTRLLGLYPATFSKDRRLRRERVDSAFAKASVERAKTEVFMMQKIDEGWKNYMLKTPIGLISNHLSNNFLIKSAWEEHQAVN